MDRQKLTTEYFTLRDAKDELELKLKEIKSRLASVEVSLVESMGVENLRNFTDERFGMVYLEDRVYASIDDFEKLKESLTAEGLQDNIRETVSTSTLSSMAKDGVELDGAKYHYQTKVKIRRKK